MDHRAIERPVFVLPNGGHSYHVFHEPNQLCCEQFTRYVKGVSPSIRWVMHLGYYGLAYPGGLWHILFCPFCGSTLTKTKGKESLLRSITRKIYKRYVG